MLIVVALYSAVGRLILIDAGGGNQYGGHHGQAAKSGSHHVAHYVAVIVFAGPDITALRTDNPGDGVVDQSVEIFNAGSLKFFLVFRVVDFLENILEAMVVFFRNGILSSEP
jgi:hypothetical protein